MSPGEYTDAREMRSAVRSGQLRLKASAFRDAGLSNGDDPKCSCSIDERGTIHRHAFCPVVHEDSSGSIG